MGEARCDRGLTIMLHGGGDMRSFAANRVAPIGADHEPRGNLPALFAAQARTLRGKRDAVDIRRLKQGEGGGSLAVQHLNQRGVGDVVAESLKPELVRRELDVRRAQETAGRIDDPDRFQRRRMRAEEHPTAQAPSACRSSFRAAPRCACRGRAARSLPAAARSARRKHRRGQARAPRRSPQAQLRPRQCRCRSLLPRVLSCPPGVPSPKGGGITVVGCISPPPPSSARHGIFDTEGPETRPSIILILKKPLSRKLVLPTRKTKKSRHIANHDPIGRVFARRAASPILNNRGTATCLGD